MTRYGSFRKHLQKKLKDPRFAKGYTQELEKARLAIEITELRSRLGLTQAQLAKRIRSSQPTIARLENPNYGRYSLATLRKVAKALNAELVISLKPKKAA